MRCGHEHEHEEYMRGRKSTACSMSDEKESMVKRASPNCFEREFARPNYPKAINAVKTPNESRDIQKIRFQALGLVST